MTYYETQRFNQENNGGAVVLINLYCFRKQNSEAVNRFYAMQVDVPTPQEAEKIILLVQATNGSKITHFHTRSVITKHFFSTGERLRRIVEQFDFV